MKNLFFFAILFLNICNSNAQQWEWATNARADRIAVDSAGNFYTSENKYDNATLKDTIIKRFNYQGQLQWQKQIIGDLKIRGMVADNSGDLFIAGYFSYFSIDADSFFSKGSDDIFLGKIDSSGSLGWYKIFGGPAQDVVTDLYIDKNQNIIICGNVGSDAVIENDSFVLSQIFLARYKTSGVLDFLWHNPGGAAWEVTADINDNIYLLGAIFSYEAIDFGNGVALYGGDYYGSHFVAKFSAGGNAIWAKNLGSNYHGARHNLGADSYGNLYLTKQGYYSSFYLWKFDNTGNPWWYIFTNAYSGGCHDLRVDNNDNILMAGYLNAYSVPTHYPFIWRYSSSGELVNTITETSFDVTAENIYPDYNNNYYISGNFLDSQIFGNTTLYAAQGNYFIAKLKGFPPKAKFISEDSNCGVQSITFTNTSISADSIQWEFPGGAPSVSFSDTTVSVFYDSLGTYSVKLIAINNISSDTLIKTIAIFENPALPVITQISNTLFSSYENGNQWIYESDTINLATKPEYDITLEGNYRVVYTDSNGCHSVSEPQYATFDGIANSYPAVSPAWIKLLNGVFLGDNRFSITNTSHNGFIICATRKDCDTCGSFTVLFKYDSAGTQEWTKIIYPVDMWAKDIKQTPDSGYILLGEFPGSDIAVVKLNKSGEVDFNTIVKADSSPSYGESIEVCNDGGYITNGSFNGYDYVLKMDDNGNNMWAKVYAPGWANGFSIYQTVDNGYIFNGYGSFPPLTSNHNFLCKTDSLGNKQWFRIYRNLGATSIASSMIIANNGGFIITGTTMYTAEDGNDAFVLKTDGNGLIQWCKIYGTVYDEEALEIQSTGNGYTVLGKTQGFQTKSDLYLFKIDNSGNLLWSRSYGTYEDDKGSAFVRTPDSGFAIAGLAGESILFVKTDSLGNTGCTSFIVHTKEKDIFPFSSNYLPQVSDFIVSESWNLFSEAVLINDSDMCFMEGQFLSQKSTINSSLQNKKIKIFPNPVSDFLTLESDIILKQISIYNTLGEKSYEVNQSTNRMIFDFTKSPKGIYFFEVVYESGRETGKIIIQ